MPCECVRYVCCVLEYYHLSLAHMTHRTKDCYSLTTLAHTAAQRTYVYFAFCIRTTIAIGWLVVARMLDCIGLGHSSGQPGWAILLSYCCSVHSYVQYIATDYYVISNENPVRKQQKRVNKRSSEHLLEKMQWQKQPTSFERLLLLFIAQRRRHSNEPWCTILYEQGSSQH